MQELKFRTNIKCEGCIAQVRPFLDEIKGINHWEVDIKNVDKILTVTTEEVSLAQVQAAVKRAGYEALSI